jgi:hypothetical protein
VFRVFDEAGNVIKTHEQTQSVPVNHLANLPPLSDRQACVKAILLTIYVVSLLSACTTGEQMSRLEPGMTRQQVVGILGRPNAVRSNGPYEQLEYTHRLITGWSWDRSDFKVILKDGRVIEFGHGEVRDRTPQVVYNATPTLTPARAYYDDQQGQLDRIEQQNRDIQQDLENQRAAQINGGH